MTKEIHLNAPVRNCQNCAHRVRDSYGIRYDKCMRFQIHCSVAVRYKCGDELSEWRPIPPRAARRSLRRWLMDTLWSA